MYISVTADQSTIDVDGRLRPRHNNLGNPIHVSDTGIVGFWRWFGKSKAVDSLGRPVVMYHGSKTRFRTIDLRKSMDIGFHVGSLAAAEHINRIRKQSLKVSFRESPNKEDLDTIRAINGEITGTPANKLYTLFLLKKPSVVKDLYKLILKRSTSEIEKKIIELENARGGDISDRIKRGMLGSKHGNKFIVEHDGEFIAWFSTEEEAHHFKDSVSDKVDHILQVYVKVEKTVLVKDQVYWTPVRVMNELGYTDSEKDAMDAMDGSEQRKYAELRRRLLAQGYNGLRYVNEREDRGHTSYIMLDSGFVKAVENDGTWDDVADMYSRVSI